jgi:hypothetical protein
MVSKKRENDILTSLKETKDVYELSEILTTISPDEIPLISGYIPGLLKHKSWLVKTDVLELIASGRLMQFEKPVLSILKREKFYITRKFALATYHELVGNRAIPILKKYTKDRYRIVRLCALCRLFLMSEKKNILDQIVEIVSKKDCGVWDHYYVYNFMIGNFDVKRKPEILFLIKLILKQSAPSTGLAREIKSYLRKTKVSGAENN